MLILTRRTNQSIMIAHNIVVTVLEVDAGQVRLGIEAPRDIPVHREEVYAAIKRENAAAALGDRDAPVALGDLTEAPIPSPAGRGAPTVRVGPRRTAQTSRPA